MMFEFLLYVLAGCIVVAMMFAGPWLVALVVAIFVRHHDAFEQTGGKMSNYNPWRYFRRVGDNYIRRVRSGGNGDMFRRGGIIEPAESLAFYLNNENFTEITEAEAVDILGDRPWEPELTLEPDPKPHPQPATPIADNPPPVPSSGDTWKLVIADMIDRRDTGIARYGTPLQPDNGRKNLVDAYQETLDLSVYIRNEIEIREKAVALLREAQKPCSTNAIAIIDQAIAMLVVLEAKK